MEELPATRGGRVCKKNQIIASRLEKLYRERDEANR